MAKPIPMDKLIRKISPAYDRFEPDVLVRAWKMFKRPAKKQDWLEIGDTLARFIVIELAETAGREKTREQQLDTAVDVMQSAADSLDNIVNKLAHEQARRS